MNVGPASAGTFPPCGSGPVPTSSPPLCVVDPYKQFLAKKSGCWDGGMFVRVHVCDGEKSHPGCLFCQKSSKGGPVQTFEQWPRPNIHKSGPAPTFTFWRRDHFRTLRNVCTGPPFNPLWGAASTIITGNSPSSEEADPRQLFRAPFFWRRRHPGRPLWRRRPKSKGRGMQNWRGGGRGYIKSRPVQTFPAVVPCKRMFVRVLLPNVCTGKPDLTRTNIPGRAPDTYKHMTSQLPQNYRPNILTSKHPQLGNIFRSSPPRPLLRMFGRQMFVRVRPPRRRGQCWTGHCLYVSLTVTRTNISSHPTRTNIRKLLKEICGPNFPTRKWTRTNIAGPTLFWARKMFVRVCHPTEQPTRTNIRLFFTRNH